MLVHFTHDGQSNKCISGVQIKAYLSCESEDDRLSSSKSGLTTPVVTVVNGLLTPATKQDEAVFIISQKCD